MNQAAKIVITIVFAVGLLFLALDPLRNSGGNSEEPGQNSPDPTVEQTDAAGEIAAVEQSEAEADEAVHAEEPTTETGEDAEPEADGDTEVVQALLAAESASANEMHTNLDLPTIPEITDPDSQPGRLLSIEAHQTYSADQISNRVGGPFVNNGERAPSIATGASQYLISFTTTAPDGSPAVGQAQLFLPETPTYEALFLFAPGSTGLAASCGPMQELLRTGNTETYAATALAYAGQGLPSVLPDYLYVLGQDELQPYFVANAEAAVLLDAIRSSHAAVQQLGANVDLKTNFMAGYSQGGHAIFAAADRAASYAPEVNLGGIVGFGASGEVDVLFMNFHYTAPWVVWSYINSYPEAGLSADQVLIPMYANRIEQDVRNFCVTEAQNSYPVESDSIYTEQFWNALTTGNLEASFPAWHEAFEANATALRHHDLPVLILQGVDDPIVPINNQSAYVAQLCAQGSAVRYANYLRTRHETRYVGFDLTLEWVRGLLDGEVAPSDCQEVMP